MAPLKIGRNHIFTDHILNVVTPSNQGNSKDAAVVRFANGTEEVFYGEDADAIREWLAGQSAPAKAAIVTKDVPAKVTPK